MSVSPTAQADKLRPSLWLRLGQAWSHWAGASVNRSIFGAAVAVGFFSLLAKFVSMFKELAVARTFGTGDALDAFLTAYLLPSFAVAVVAGSINSALVPVFVKVRQGSSHVNAQRLLSNVTLINVLGLMFVAVALAAVGSFAFGVIGSGFSPEKLALTRSLHLLLLPLLVVSGLSSTWSAVLNADQRFALPSLAPAITPLMTVIALLLLEKQWGVYTLVAGALAGAAFEALVLGSALRRHGLRPVPMWHGFDLSTRSVVKQLAPLSAGTLLMSSSPMIDQAMASALETGSVSTLNYGNRIVGFTISLGALAIGTAILPYFSRLTAVSDWVGIRHTLRTYVRLLALISVPLTVLLVWFSEPITRLLFERGNFTASDTRQVAGVMCFFAFQVPFYLTGIVGVRLLSAMNKGKTIMTISTCNMVVNVVGNLVLIRYLGVAGIALSTSIVYFLSSLFIFGAVSQELRRRDKG